MSYGVFNVADLPSTLAVIVGDAVTGPSGPSSNGSGTVGAAGNFSSVATPANFSADPSKTLVKAYGGGGGEGSVINTAQAGAGGGGGGTGTIGSAGSSGTGVFVESYAGGTSVVLSEAITPAANQTLVFLDEHHGHGGEDATAVTYPTGMIIYGRWIEVVPEADADGGVICYFGH